MHVRPTFLAKLLLSLALAFGAFVVLVLAIVGAFLFAPVNLAMSLVLGIAGAFLIIGIIRVWRQPDGWRFALGAGFAALSVWAVLEYGSPYLSPPSHVHSIGAP
jgi:hypothetical protein